MVVKHGTFSKFRYGNMVHIHVSTLFVQVSACIFFIFFISQSNGYNKKLMINLRRPHALRKLVTI